MLSVHRIINNPVSSNCFVIYDKEHSSACIIVDPGTKNDEGLLRFIHSHGLTPEYIILTHEHFDHCWGVNCVESFLKIPIVCSQLCAEAIQNEKRNCSVFYDNLEAFVVNGATISIESLGMGVVFAGKDIQFYATPGHTEASISFTMGNLLFTGDTLIKNERTVTKLPTGSELKLKESLMLFEKMRGKGFIVHPGHGDLFELDEYDVFSSL